MSARFTKKEIIKEIIHCGRDPLYFIDTYCKIQHATKGLIPFKTFNYQKDIVQAYLTHRMNIFLKARQLGITTITSAYIAWFILFHRDKNVLIVATKQDVAKNTIRTIRNIYKYLPKWMMDVGKVELNNRFSIELENGSRVKAVTTTEDVGRSEAVSFLVVDEVAHIKNFDEIWTGLWPTVSCVAGSTRILTENGFIKISDLCKNREIGEYFEQNGNIWGKNGLEPISHGYVSPESETLVVETHHGLKVEVTKKHPLYKLFSNKCGMEQAQNLKVGDYLRIDVGMNIWSKNKLFDHQDSDKLAYMLGGYIAEGWITNKDTLIEISNQDEEFRKIYFENKIIKNFVSKNNDKYRIRCSSIELIKLFKSLGVNTEWKCYSKRVPEKIWQSTKEDIASFLRGYFDGDGCVTNRGICAVSTSKELLQDIQQLLLNFGIISNISIRFKDKSKINNRIMPSGQILKKLLDSYILYIPLSQTRLYLDNINFNIKRKREKAENLSFIISQDDRKQYSIPLNLIREHLFKLIQQTNQSYVWFRKNGLRLDKIKYGKFINVAWIRKFLEITNLEDQFLKDLCSKCFWDSIKSIMLSTNRTYDLTLPRTHMFLQNGIMGSNTGGCIALFSTPKGTGNFFHRCFIQAKNNENNFNCKLGTYVNPKDPQEFYDDRVMWWVHPDHDDAWFQAETAGKSPREIAQEYLCSFNASGDTFIYHETINNIEKNIKVPLRTFTIDRNVWIFEEPDKNGTYLIGVDVSRGDAQDYSAFHVVRLDVCPLNQVAEYKGKIKPDHLGMLLVEVSKFYNNAIIAPEYNSGWSGPTILKIQEANHPFLYYSRKRKSKLKEHQLADPYYAQERNDFYPGYSVTPANRNQMLAKMEQYVRLGDIIINSSRTLEEFKTFIVTEFGRAEAQRGMSDDLVMALVGLLWVRDEAFLNTYRTDEVTKALLESMSTSNTTIGQFKDFSYNSGQYDRARIVKMVENQNKMVMGDGNILDLNWLLSKG